MAEYIEREAAVEKIQRLIDGFEIHPEMERGLCIAIGEIRQTPAADVVEVRHGRWLLAGSNRSKLRRKKVSFFYCSECGRMVDIYKNEVLLEEYPFCHCGAKMDVGVDHADD